MLKKAIYRIVKIMIHIMFIFMKQEMKNVKIQMKWSNLMLEENQAFMYSIWKKQKISKQEKILIIKM